MKFNEMKEGVTYTIPVLVLQLEDAVTKGGGNYIKLTCTDGEENITATMFDAKTEKYTRRGLRPETVAVITLKKQNNYYNFSALEPNQNPELKPEAFAKTAPIDIEKGWRSILLAVESVMTSAIGEVTLSLLMKYKTSILHSSAAQSMHHDYIGGLIHHTLYMVQTAEKICEVYTDLNKELLVCGAALHDIAKIREMHTSPLGNAKYTTEGVLLGHLMMGAQMIEKEYQKKYPRNETEEGILLLMHLVASHHGLQEWGAVATPACKEAYALHMIDMLDSRMRMFDNAYQNIEKGTVSENRIFGLDTKVYHPTFS